MDKKTYGMIATVLAIAIVAFLISAKPAGDIITQEGNTTVVNTQQLGQKVKGYIGATPVKIYIHKNKIEKIEPLANRETPKYFARAKTLLKQYEGKSVTKATKIEVDGVSGATLSSDALKKNVQLGLTYYKEHQ